MFLEVDSCLTWASVCLCAAYCGQSLLLQLVQHELITTTILVQYNECHPIALPAVVLVCLDSLMRPLLASGSSRAGPIFLNPA